MNILIVRNDKLGDFVTTLPSIYALKNFNVQYKIIVLVSPVNRNLAEALPFIDKVIVDEGQPLFSLVQSLKTENIDISITMFSNTRVAIAQFFANIKKRVAPATKIAQIFYTIRIRQKRSRVKMSELEYNFELIKQISNNISLSYPQPLLTFKEKEKEYKYKNYIAFHVGSGGSSDANWNLDEYVILIKDILKRKKENVLLTFGPDEKDLYNEMKAKMKNITSVEFYISDNGILPFCNILSSLKLFISTSTGTFHLASLVGTPTLTFFADTLFSSPKRWKGIGDIKLQYNVLIPKNLKEREECFTKTREYLQKLL